MARHSFDDSYPQENEGEMFYEEDASFADDSRSPDTPIEDSTLSESSPDYSSEQPPSDGLATSSRERQVAPPYYKPMAQTVTGAVAHPSGEELSRPVDFPRRYNIVLIMFVIAACVAGVFLFSQYYSNIVNGAAKEQAQMQSYLSRGVSLDLPVLTDYANLSDDEIRASLQNAGYQIHDVSDDGSSLDLIKSPSDVSATEAAALFSTGINKLSASDAAKLLCGFWRLDTSRTDGYTIRVRYVDFTSGDVTSALNNCLAAEKIDGATMTEEGEDTSGNTYKTGVVNVDGINYQWRASTIPLSKVYDIGLPSSSVYVGFRLTQLA